MNDWSSFMSTLDGHKKAMETALTNYPPVKLYDAQTAAMIYAHLDAMVECCDQVAAHVKNNSE